MFTFALVLGLTGSVRADEVKGTVRSVFPDRNELVLKGVLKDTGYVVSKDAWISLDGRKCKLADLKEGDKVTMDWGKQGATLITTGIRGFRNASQTTGTVRYVIADKNELVLKGVVKDSVYHLDKNIMITLNGKAANFSDLREGDSVDITYLQNGDRLTTTEIRASRK